MKRFEQFEKTEARIIRKRKRWSCLGYKCVWPTDRLSKKEEKRIYRRFLKIVIGIIFFALLWILFGRVGLLILVFVIACYCFSCNNLRCGVCRICEWNSRRFDLGSTFDSNVAFHVCRTSCMNFSKLLLYYWEYWLRTELNSTEFTELNSTFESNAVFNNSSQEKM